MTRGKHGTMPQGTRRAIRWLEAQPDVARLIFGAYSHRGRGRPMEVLGPCRGGIWALARGEDKAMELFIHTATPDSLIKRIGTRFGGKS